MRRTQSRATCLSAAIKLEEGEVKHVENCFVSDDKKRKGRKSNW
jgi:hypothetical protein